MRVAKPVLLSSPEECEQAFYEALEAGDSEAVVDLWLEDDDVVCIHPGGPRLTGFAAVRSSWTSILANGPLHARCTLAKSLETPTVALHNVVEEVVVGSGAKQEVVRVLATNVYVKTPAGWKMVLHHASSAPGGAVTASTEPSESYGVLH
ncbi:MAG TPA: nuclear transport factor 2 family protein [Burkholderiaceae bacterium]|jgi:ketosteroid isomerase-like protein|nr:nuclear transport factor 2 family protein [Burkholderiaceae bacterium]